MAGPFPHVRIPIRKFRLVVPKRRQAQMFVTQDVWFVGDGVDTAGIYKLAMKNSSCSRRKSSDAGVRKRMFDMLYRQGVWIIGPL